MACEDSSIFIYHFIYRANIIGDARQKNRWTLNLDPPDRNNASSFTGTQSTFYSANTAIQL